VKHYTRKVYAVNKNPIGSLGVHQDPPYLQRKYSMLSSIRKTYDAAFKAKVAFEAAKGEKMIVQIASEFNVHPHQVR
jgi:hypothetical protein